MDRPEPYQESILAGIQSGVTTREEIIELLGSPNVVRQQGSVWLYGESRPAVLLITTKGSSTIHDYQTLLIDFDQDMVSHYEVIEDQYGCSATGYCVAAGWDSEYLNQTTAVITTNSGHDAIAKKYNTPSDKCSLYVYVIAPFGGYGEWKASVDVGSIKNAVLNEDAFLNVLLEPGENQITARAVIRNNTELDHEHDPEILVFDCRAGNQSFLQIGFETWHMWHLFVDEIQVADMGDGRNAVEDRNLLVLP